MNAIHYTILPIPEIYVYNTLYNSPYTHIERTHICKINSIDITECTLYNDQCRLVKLCLVVVQVYSVHCVMCVVYTVYCRNVHCVYCTSLYFICCTNV